MTGALILVVLLAHFSAHVALVARLYGTIEPWRVALSFFIAPFAPYFGFRSGLVRTSWVWIATLALYACLVGLVRGCV
jgi:hypothetical protein